MGNNHNKNKIGLILLLLILLAGGLFLLYTLLYSWFAKEMRVEMEERIGGGEVDFVKMQVGIPPSVVLSDVTLSNERTQEKMSVEKIIIKCNFWKSFRVMEPVIKEVAFIKPRIEIIRDREGRWNWSNLLNSVARGEEPLKIVVRDADISIMDRSSNFKMRLKKVSLKYKAGHFALCGKIPKGEVLKVKGYIRTQPLHVNWKLRAKRIPTSYLPFSFPFGKLSEGYVNLRLSGGYPVLDFLDGKASLRDAQFEFADKICKNLLGEFSFTPKRKVEIRKLRFKMDGVDYNIKGVIPDFEKGEAQIQIFVKEFQVNTLADLLNLNSLKRLNLAGALNFDGIIKFEPNLSADGTITLFHDKGSPLKCEFNYSEKKLQISTLKIGEKMVLQGEIDLRERKFTHLVVQQRDGGVIFGGGRLDEEGGQINLMLENFQLAKAKISSIATIKGCAKTSTYQVSFDNLVVNQVELGRVGFEVKLGEENLVISPLYHDESNYLLRGEVFFEPFRLSLELMVREGKIEVLREAFSGYISGKVKLSREKGGTFLFGENLEVKGLRAFGLNLRKGSLSFGGVVEEGIEIKKLTFNEESLVVSGFLNKKALELLVNLNGFDLNQTMQVFGKLKIKGSPPEFRAGGWMNLTGWKMSPIRIDGIDGKFSLKGKTLLFERITAKAEGSTVIASGRIEDGGEIEVKFRISTPGLQKEILLTGKVRYKANKLEFKEVCIDNAFHLDGEVDVGESKLNAKMRIEGGEIPTLLHLLSLDTPLLGKVSGWIEAFGCATDPIIEGDLSFKELNLFELPIAEDGKVRFSFGEKTLTVKNLVLRRGDGGILYAKECAVECREGGRIKVGAEMKDFEFGKLKMREVNFSGRIANLNPLKIEGDIHTKDFCIGNFYKVSLLKTSILWKGREMRFLGGEMNGRVYFGKTLLIDDIKLLDERGEVLSLNGELFPDREEMDLRIEVKRANLTLNKELVGNWMGNFSVRGWVDEVEIDGEIDVKGGNVRLPFLVDKITDLQGKIKIRNDGFTIPLLRAKIGKEELLVKTLEYSTFKNLNLSLSMKNPIKVSFPGLLNGRIKAKVNVEGKLDEPKLSGTIEIYDASFTYPPAEEGATGFFKKINWNTKFLARKGVKYYNDYVELKVEEGSWIKIVGKRGKDLSVFGEVRSSSGELEYLGTEFYVCEAILKIIKPNSELHLRIKAKTMVEGTLVMLRFDGPLFQGEPILTTPNLYPPKTKREIISMLRYGRDYEKLEEADLNAFLQVGIARMVGKGLDVAVLNPIERKIRTLLRMDVDFKIPYVEGIIEELLPSEIAQEERSTVEFKFGKFITDDLYLNYKGSIQKKLERWGLKQEWGIWFYLSDQEMIKYRYRPGEEGGKHEIILDKQIRF